MKNCLKIWPLLVESDKKHFIDARVTLADWVSAKATMELGRPIPPHAVPMLSKRDMLKCFRKYHPSDWYEEVKRIIYPKKR